jgi:two-component system chemotaxis response regulator CheY
VKFLIVDDSEAARFMLKSMLETLGHSVVGEAGSAEEAIAACDKIKPEAVTLDLSLSRGNGLEVLKGLRAKGSVSKVIVISGNSQKKVQDELRALGASGFLCKPFNLEELAAALKEIK